MFNNSRMKSYYIILYLKKKKKRNGNRKLEDIGIPSHPMEPSINVIFFFKKTF